MSMLKDYPCSIEELATTTPKKKAALIRSLLPTIEAALRSGQMLKDIWETLDKQGLNVGYHVFQMTLWRARTAPGSQGKDSKPSDSQRPPDGDVSTVTRVKAIYAACHRAEWFAKIHEPGVHRRAEFYY